MRNLIGTYTVITGASSGIGREAARMFAARSSSLVLCARREQRLSSLRDELLDKHHDIDVLAIPVDLGNERQTRALYERTRALPARTWLNCAGFGGYGSIREENVEEMERMLELNMRALAILSALFAKDHARTPGAQLINVSSAGGYTLVPDAVTYCATKFFVSAFTEGLDRELRAAGAAMRAKVFAPAATRTEFGKIASHTDRYVYEERFARFHTAEHAAHLLMDLYDSDASVGLVDRETFEFRLTEPLLPFAGNSAANQRSHASDS